MRTNTTLVGSAALALALSAGAAAHADTVPLDQVFQEAVAGINNATAHGPGTLTETCTNCFGAGSSASGVATLPQPSVTSTINVTAASPNTNAQAVIDFYFYISGPIGSAATINITDHGMTAVANTSNFANAYLFGNFVGTLGQACSGGPCAGTASTFAVNGNYNVSINQEYVVELFSSVSAQLGSAGAQVGTPIFTVLTPGDQIFFSAGVQNGGSIAPGVPEPATWGMMLLGFVGLGFAFRRRVIGATA